MDNIINGKKLSNEKRKQLKNEIEQLSLKFKRKPKLVVYLVGEDVASKLYVKNKALACKQVGIDFILFNFPSTIYQQDLYDHINKSNNDHLIDAILLQLPLPQQFEEAKFLQAISDKKDVDGFNFINAGKLFQNFDFIIPCTPKGIIDLLDAYKIDVFAKQAVIIGSSNIVGKPLAIMLLHKGATVTICNKNTVDLPKYTRQADLLFTATGKKQIITKDMVKENVIVIDIGINIDNNNKLTGDVDFDNVQPLCKWITPVPGGVGPMTVTALLENTVILYKHNKGNNKRKYICG